MTVSYSHRNGYTKASVSVSVSVCVKVFVAYKSSS